MPPRRRNAAAEGEEQPPQDQEMEEEGDEEEEEEQSNPGQNNNPNQNDLMATLIDDINRFRQEQLDMRQANALLQEQVNNQAQRAPTSHAKDKEPKLPDPTPFSGQRNRLRTFLSEVETIFEGQPSRYSTEPTKVIYVGSYLKGNPKAWWQPHWSSEPRPQWMSSYEGVKGELLRNFGDPNETQAAERKLSSVRQKGSVQEYDTEFSSLAMLTKWNNEALAAQFYRGLKDNIKDELSKTARPEDYLDLKRLTLQIDTRTFERQIERGDRTYPSTRLPTPYELANRFTRHTSYPATTPNFSENTNRGGSYQPRATSSSPRVIAPSFVKSENRYSSPPNNLRASYADDTRTRKGKLDPAEYQRRRDQDLCLYCGKAGHQVATCRIAPPAVIRAASTLEHFAFPQAGND